MSQLTRKLFKLFCANKVSTPTDNIGIFGSKKAGASAWSSDPDSIQSAHYLNGWTDAVVSNQAPCMDDMNALQYVFSYMIKYLYQTGLPEWLSTEEYYQFSFVRYNGSVWVSVYNGQNTDTPQDSSAKWKRLVLPKIWIGGTNYNTGDVVSYNGRTYRCVRSHTASSIFEDDFYLGIVDPNDPTRYLSGAWDDGNPAGTLVHSLTWNKAYHQASDGSSDLPYNYFDITGFDAGRELPISSYNNLYNVIGQYYKNGVNYSANPPTTYPDPASGNFRLPDFRNTFFKNSGSHASGHGHNASHTHAHNRTSTFSLAHDHILGGDTPMSNGSNVFVPKFYGTQETNATWVWISQANKGFVRGTTLTANLSIPPLTISNQGSGSTPEPNFYGVKVFLKY